MDQYNNRFTIRLDYIDIGGSLNRHVDLRIVYIVDVGTAHLAQLRWPNVSSTVGPT